MQRLLYDYEHHKSMLQILKIPVKVNGFFPEALKASALSLSGIIT